MSRSTESIKLLDRCLPDWIQRKHKPKLALV